MSDLEMPEVMHELHRTARKAHRCSECRRERIRPGDSYDLIEGLWDGQWERYKVCARCERARRRFYARRKTCDLQDQTRTGRLEVWFRDAYEPALGSLWDGIREWRVDAGSASARALSCLAATALCIGGLLAIGGWLAGGLLVAGMLSGIAASCAIVDDETERRRAHR